jgi:hypothetical protein
MKSDLRNAPHGKQVVDSFAVEKTPKALGSSATQEECDMPNWAHQKTQYPFGNCFEDSIVKMTLSIGSRPIMVLSFQCSFGEVT